MINKHCFLLRLDLLSENDSTWYWWLWRRWSWISLVEGAYPPTKTTLLIYSCNIPWDIADQYVTVSKSTPMQMVLFPASVSLTAVLCEKPSSDHSSNYKKPYSPYTTTNSTPSTPMLKHKYLKMVVPAWILWRIMDVHADNKSLDGGHAM